MKHIALKTILILPLLFVSTVFATASPSSTNAAAMLKQVTTGVVNVKAYGVLPPNISFDEDKSEDKSDLNFSHKDHAKNQPHHFVASGSGIVISSKKGYIVTNAHVIQDAEKIIVTLKDGQQYTAKKIGMDEASDIALLKISASHLTELPIANSNMLEVGDKIYAIGNPFGLNSSVTSGIVSALDRGDLNLETYENFIQIDASINPGNSGGALVNAQGEVVGMNTAILTAEDNGGSIGIGFAIPSNMLTAVIPQLIKYGKVDRGVVGILAQDFSTTLANAMHIPDQDGGAIITAVMPYSPAKNADLQVGDVILQIDDTPVHTASQVVNTVGFMRVGTKVNITLLRNSKQVKTSITIMDAEKQKALAEQYSPYFNNASLQDISFYSSENGYVNGVSLMHIEKDSTEWIAGLRPGDIILSANGTSVTTVHALQEAIASAKDSLALLVLHQHAAAYVVLTPEGNDDDDEHH